MHLIVLSIVFLIGIAIPASSYAMTDELDANDIFALDDIRQSGLESVIDRNIFIFNLDSRVITGPGDILPFHKFSIWRFFKQENGMNFCVPGLCADPIRFEYKFYADRICFERTEQEIAGCYSLISRNNQLDWIDKEGNHVMTSFTAIFVERLDQFEKIWKIFITHMSHELSVLGMHKEEIIVGLISLGLLDPNAKHQFDASVRTAIVSFQRKARIFPTGFVDKATFEAVLNAIK